MSDFYAWLFILMIVLSGIACGMKGCQTGERLERGRWEKWALNNGYAHFDPQTGELILHEKGDGDAP